VKLIALLLALMLSGCAITRSPASDAATADVATTGLGLLAGAAEADPVGLALIPVKLALLAHTETLPDVERLHAQTTLSAFWNAAAVNNVCVLLVVMSAGAASLPCILLGAGYGLWGYTTAKADQMQAEFMAMCLDARRANPGMKCFLSGVEV
jgi:hypothetical protein